MPDPIRENETGLRPRPPADQPAGISDHALAVLARHGYVIDSVTGGFAPEGVFTRVVFEPPVRVVTPVPVIENTMPYPAQATPRRRMSVNPNMHTQVLNRTAPRQFRATR